MKLVSGLAAPTSKNVAGFWLSAIGLGMGLAFLHYLFLFNLEVFPAIYGAAVDSAMALIFSVPSLLLLLLFIPWALRKPFIIHTWLRLTLAQFVSAGITTLLIYWRSNEYHHLIILKHALPYVVAGLLVIYWRYSAWLISRG